MVSAHSGPRLVSPRKLNSVQEDEPASPLVGNFVVSNGNMQVKPQGETTKVEAFKAPEKVEPQESTRKPNIVPESSRVQLKKLLDSKEWTTVITIGILVALFLADIAMAAHFDDTASSVVYTILCILLGFFCIELVLNCIAIPDYLWGFFFVMDFLGTVSILFDIPWITDPLGINFSNGAVMRASKAARVGSRAGRMSKLVRVLRAVRVVRVLKIVSNYWNKRTEDQKEQLKDSSKIGSTLSESISKEVAALTIIAILVAPLLAFDEVDQSPSVYLDLFQVYAPEPGCTVQDLAIFEQTVATYNDYMDDGYYKPISLTVGDWSQTFSSRPERDLDTQTLDDGCVEMVFNISKKNEETALFNIGLVLFVILLLTFFSMLLNATVTRLVVNPLERMFNSIQTNAKQMFEALGSVGIDMKEKNEDDDDDAAAEEEVDELADMEAVIEKMSKLVSHVSGTGSQGSHLVDNLLGDAAVDDASKDYIRTLAVDHGSTSTTRKDREQLSRRLTKTSSIRADTQLVPNGNSYQLDRPVDIELMDTYNWNVFSLEEEDIYAYVITMFDRLELLEGGFVHTENLVHLLKHVRAEMPDNPYHNFRHVIDVTHTVYRMICLTIASTDMSKLEKMALMVGALCHDLGHPGSNNAFLVNTKHQLATRYNDTSVLENSHVSRLYTIIEENPEADVFASIKDTDDWWEVRKMIIHCILCTDMAKHFEMVSKIEVFFELRGVAHELDSPNSDGECIFKTKEERNLMLTLFMHAADISNPVKPIGIYQKWAECVMSEFFRQGDMEKSRGLPISPMMDRTSTSTPLSQVNFIEFVVAPLYYTLVKLFPQLWQFESNLCTNRAEYGMRYQDEVDQMAGKDVAWKEEEKTKIEKRLSTFNAKHLVLAQSPAPKTPRSRPSLSPSKQSAVLK